VDQETASFQLKAKRLDHESSAHYCRVMRNITLSADAHVIELAREEARLRKTTLNALFREWLEEIACRDQGRKKMAEIVERMGHYDSGGPFTREEMNER
jgi:hypothetical protein